MGDRGRGECENYAKFDAGSILSHPVRARIIAYLLREKRGYTSKIAMAVDCSERVVAFHLSVLSAEHLLDSEYALSNPARKVVRWYTPNELLKTTFQDYVSALVAVKAGEDN
jgi:DNA-binding transcriptional ArsR family regulator